MHRREFLGALAIGLPAWHGWQASSPQGRRVIIIGAGLAGLSAALELRTAGWEVAILEARTRAGGRVFTLRAPFSDGLYAEAGAARIQDSHAYTLRYVKQLNLTLDPFFPSEGNSVAFVAGRRLVQRQGMPVDFAQLPHEFTAEERKMGLRGGLMKYLFAHVKELGDPTDSNWLSRDLSRFEVPIDEFCRQNGASAAFTRLVALGHDLHEMSTLQFLRDTVLGSSTKQWFKIRGGNDLLPAGLAALLTEHIRYGSPVLRIEQDDRSVRVTYNRGNAPVTIAADYVISTASAPVMATIDVSPALPDATRTALRELGGLAMARVHLQTTRRFWLERGDTGWAATDDPMDVWDYSRDQPGRRGILGAYLSGRIAREVSALAPEQRGEFILERMERPHPGTKEHFESAASHSWVTDEWARGAGAAFHPGQLSKFYSTLRTPVGRIHFAGEHTSPWSGWMNGALDSGHRVAAELMARGR